MGDIARAQRGLGCSPRSERCIACTAGQETADWPCSAWGTYAGRTDAAEAAQEEVRTKPTGLVRHVQAVTQYPLNRICFVLGTNRVTTYW